MGGIRLAAFAVLLALPANAGVLQLSWKELRDWTGPQCRVKIMTRDAVQLEARLDQVEEDRLVLTVLKSSDPSRYAAGQTVLERRSIDRIAVRRESKTARTGLAIFGAALMGPLMAAGGAQGYSEGSQVAGAIISGSITCGLIGYLWGRSIDNKYTDVILTDAAPPPDAGKMPAHSGIIDPNESAGELAMAADGPAGKRPPARKE